MQTRVLLMVVVIFVAPFQLMVETVSANDVFNVTTFSDGSSSQSVSLQGNTTSQQSSIDLSKNITLTNAQFELSYSRINPSPGEIWLDINDDGIREWSFGGGSQGELGRQTSFTNGLNYGHSSFNATNNQSSPFMIPTASVVTDVEMNIQFMSEFFTGFLPLGNVIDFDGKDIDADGQDELVLLTNDSNVSGYNKSINIVEWDVSTGLQIGNYFETCENGTSIHTDDFNGDGKKDIAVVSIPDAKVCLHIFNKITGGLLPMQNLSLESSVTNVGFGDLNHDGYYDIISIRPNDGIDFRLSTGNSFASTVTIPVMENNSGGTTQATVNDLLVGPLNGLSGPDFVLVKDTSDHWTIHEYNSNSNSLIETNFKFDNIQTNAMMADVDLDGDYDIIGNRGKSMVYIENTPTGLETEFSPTFIDLNRASIFDYDNNGIIDLLSHNTFPVDNNDTTIEGNFSVRHFFNASNTSSPAQHVVIPGSDARKIAGLDFNNDNLFEHVSIVGENQKGIFIGGWQEIGLDFDGDLVNDLSASGYASNGSHGVDKLVIEDSMMITLPTIRDKITMATPQLDGYGLEWSEISFNLNSTVPGDFNFSYLNVGYSLDVLVRDNPSISGNLSNVINQHTKPEAGFFNLPLPFNSTNQGIVNIQNLDIDYLQGAEVPITAPEIIVTLGSINSEAVVLEWNDMSEFGEHLEEIRVYRAVDLQAYDYENPHAIITDSQFIDEDVTVGQSYRYIVRSFHLEGVASNYSNQVNVSIPFPAPPETIQGLTASDVSEDEGGAVLVEWNLLDNNYISNYHLFHATNELNPNDDFTQLQSTLLANQTNTHLVDNLVDGVAYWFGIIAEDMFGNYSSQIAVIGPVYARNDTALFSEISMQTSPQIFLDNGFYAQISVVSETGQIEEGSVDLYMKNDTDSWLIEQDLSPQVNYSAVSFSSLGLWTQNIHGEVFFEAIYSGDEGDETRQPISTAITSTPSLVTVLADISTDSTSIEMNSFGQGQISLALQATKSSHDILLENTEFSWSLWESGQLAQSGQGQFIGGQSQFTIESSGGYLLIEPQVPAWIVLNNPNLNLTILSNGQNNSQNQNAEGEIVDPTISCSPLELVMGITNETSFQCTLSHTNPFALEITFSTNGWTPLFTDVILQPEQTEIHVEANDDISFTVLVSISSYDLLDTGTFSSTIDAAAYNETVGSIAFESKILWTIIPQPEAEVGEMNETIAPEISGSTLTTFYVGAGAIAIIGGFAWLLVTLIRKRQEDEAWSEDELDMDEIPDSYVSERRASQPLPVGMGLDEFEAEDLEEETIAPQHHRHRLFDEAEGIEMPEDEPDAQDDGVTIDEDGTEWYEDDTGVWWYRESGMDDWEEYREQ